MQLGNQKRKKKDCNNYTSEEERRNSLRVCFGRVRAAGLNSSRGRS